MSPLTWLVDGFKWLKGLGTPETLQQLVNLGGPWWLSYLILCGVVFSETGLLVGFFLPGDTLLFAAGLLATRGVFDIYLLDISLMVAAILGDAVNYWLGLTMEEQVFEKNHLRFVKHEHLLAAKAFYERHGGKAIVLARFMPIVRTFTPFVAGVAKMGYRRFALFNIVGAVGWVGLLTLTGFFLGKRPFVAKNFEYFVIGILILSLLPLVIGGLKAWRSRRRGRAAGASASEPVECANNLP